MENLSIGEQCEGDATVNVKVVVRKQKMKTENRTKRIRRFNGSLETRTVRGREREREKTTENSISK